MVSVQGPWRAPLARKVDFESVIELFASRKARKVPLFYTRCVAPLWYFVPRKEKLCIDHTLLNTYIHIRLLRCLT